MIDGSTIIDFHGHQGSFDEFLAFDDPDIMLRAMDAVGIDKSCLFNIFHPDGVGANDRTAAFVAAHPDRFIGFSYVSPSIPGGITEELTRAIDELGFRAIKLYPPYVGLPLNDAAWDPIYEFASERNLAVIAHTGPGYESAPDKFGEAAGRFPEANFVAGHAGNNEPYRSQAIDAARRNPNYYLETCSTYRTPGVIEELVEKAGADRVIYGSDIPLMDPRVQIGKVITADISDADKRLILGENARRLLKL